MSNVESTKSAKAATKRSFILDFSASPSRPRVMGEDSEWEFIYHKSHPPLKEDGNISRMQGPPRTSQNLHFMCVFIILYVTNNVKLDLVHSLIYKIIYACQLLTSVTQHITQNVLESLHTLLMHFSQHLVM